MKLAVACTTSDVTDRAAELAVELGVPLIELPASQTPDEISEFDYLVAYRGSRLVLQSIREGHSGELCVDFGDAKLSYRAKSSIRNQNIAKALGVKGGPRPHVLDATAELDYQTY